MREMVNREPDIYERIGKLLEKPEHFAVFVILLGVFMLAASIWNWDWIFSGRSYNMQKIEGVANVLGRGFARLIFGMGGVSCMVAGIIYLILL
ncbi:MAG: immunity 17 family protein [Tannerella sp.]|jgi:hypothetical protein|nr:immunity 17 family protein [Tannerella sp.]